MKVIFMCPNYHKYGEKIAKKMCEIYNVEVLYISHKLYEYKYKNIFEKIYSESIYKLLHKETLKRKKKREWLINKIDSFGSFDKVIVIRPELYDIEIIKKLKENCKKMRIHLWDSLEFIERQKEYLKYFNEKSTFDMEEAEKYNMELLPNFYFEPNFKEEKIKYDAFTVMSYDERFFMIEKLGKYFKENGLKYKFIIVTDKNIITEYLTIQKKSIDLDEVQNYINKSRAVVEIGHNVNGKMQGGLSMRAIEALGNKKKLITTYSLIKNYDFYDEANIAIIDKANINIEKNFFKTFYRELPIKIYEKYSLKEWIGNLLK